MKFSGSKLTLHVCIQGLKTGFLGFDGSTFTARIYDSGEKAFSATNLSTVGVAVARILSKPSETANRYIYIASQTTTQMALVAALEKETNKQWTVNKISSRAAAEEGRRKIANGDFSGIGSLILAATFGEGNGSNFEVDEKNDFANGLLDLPKESLQEDVRNALTGKKAVL